MTMQAFQDIRIFAKRSSAAWEFDSLSWEKTAFHEGEIFLVDLQISEDIVGCQHMDQAKPLPLKRTSCFLFFKGGGGAFQVHWQPSECLPGSPVVLILSLNQPTKVVLTNNQVRSGPVKVKLFGGGMSSNSLVAKVNAFRFPMWFLFNHVRSKVKVKYECIHICTAKMKNMHLNGVHFKHC